MKTYFLSVKKIQVAESKIPKVLKTSKETIILLSKYVAFVNKKSRFIKKQELSGLLSSLEIKPPLSKIPLLENIL